MIEIKFKNLNNAFVICKKYNGAIYFRTDWKRDARTPKYARLYWSTDEVQRELKALNENRKKCQYFRDAASKHFINLWRQDIQEHDDGRTYNWVLENEFGCIKEIKQNGLTTSKLGEMKVLATKTIEESIKHLQNDLEHYKTKINNSIKNFEALQKEIDNYDLEKAIAPYQTNGDKVAEVLYGKSNS